MTSKIKHIAVMEFNKILKGWVFLIGLISIVGGQMFLDSPLSDGHLLTELSAAYSFNHGVCMIGSFIIPFIMATLFYDDKRTSTIEIIFTQPIQKYEYVLGKFFGAFISYIAIVSIGMIINIVVPIYFKSTPYSPLVFIESFFVYTFPSMFFYSAASFLVAIIFKEVILTSIVPIFYLFLNDYLPKMVQYIIRGKELGALVQEDALPIDILNLLVQNRILLIFMAICLLLISISMYSPKSYIERRKSL